MFKNVVLQNNNGSIYFNNTRYGNKCLLNSIAGALNLDPALLLQMSVHLRHQRMIDLANEYEVNLIKQLAKQLLISIRVYSGIYVDNIWYINQSQYQLLGTSSQIVNILCTGCHFMWISCMDDIYLPYHSSPIRTFAELRLALSDSEMIEKTLAADYRAAQQIEKDRLMAKAIADQTVQIEKDRLMAKAIADQTVQIEKDRLMAEQIHNLTIHDLVARSRRY